MIGSHIMSMTCSTKTFFCFRKLLEIMYTLEDSFMLIKEDAASCSILWEERQVQMQIVVLFALLQRRRKKSFVQF